MKKPEFIDVKGLLSFHIMWVLSQKRMYGEQLMQELGRRRADEPSPGTLYPALNSLKEEGLIKKERDDKRVIYTLTPKGKKDLELAVRWFRNAYGDVVTDPSSRSISYSPKHKRTSEGDELEIDFI